MAGSTVSDMATRLNCSFQKPTQASGNYDPALFPTNSNEVGLCDQGQNKESTAHSRYGKSHHTICRQDLQVQAAFDIGDETVPGLVPKYTDDSDFTACMSFLLAHSIVYPSWDFVCLTLYFLETWSHTESWL